MAPRSYVLELPLPPSINRIIKKLGNRSPIVQEWIELAHGYVYEQKPIQKFKGAYLIEITWPISRWSEEKGGRFDASNRVKPLEDYLEKIGVIENDKFCWKLEIGWGQVEHDMCRVEIWPKLGAGECHSRKSSSSSSSRSTSARRPHTSSSAATGAAVSTGSRRRSSRMSSPSKK